MDQMILFMYWAAGILVHVAATAAKYKVDVKTYFISRPVSTVASIFVSAGLALSFWAQGITDFMSYFGTAYLAESLINRYEVQQNVQTTVGQGDAPTSTGCAGGSGTGSGTIGDDVSQASGAGRGSGTDAAG